MQNPIGEADLEWILHRNCEGTEQLQIQIVWGGRNVSLLLSVFEQGMIYAIMALGVYITYKILDFPDLTVDGSFPMGAAITAVMITNGVPAILTLPVCFLVGALAGVLTGLIHVKLKVRDLLSGIIMMTALYTVNLRIAGRANLPFYKEVTVFDKTESAREHWRPGKSYS